MTIEKLGLLDNRKHYVDKAKRAYDDLADLGYAVIPNVLAESECLELVHVLNQIRIDRDNMSTENRTAGTTEEQRFIEATGQILLRDCLLDRPEVFLDYVDLPLVTSTLSLLFREMSILDGFSASTTYCRDPRYSHPPKVHIDSRIATTEIRNTTHLGVMICLDDFSDLNGCTRVWPGSHKSGIVIHKDPDFMDREPPGALDLHSSRGSVILFLGQTWHQVGTNHTEQSRWGLLLTYTRWWVKPQTDYTLCGEAIFDRCTTEQKILLGFASMPPRNRFTRSKMIMSADEIPTNYADARNVSTHG